MSKKSIITAGQLFVTLYVTRMIVNITYTPLIAKSNNLWDYLASSVISFFLVMVLIIPVYKLCSADKKLDIAEYSYFLFGKFGFIIVLIYAIYYLIVCIYTLSLFNVFVSNVISPEISLYVLSASVIIASCYGAYKGIEAIVRTAGLIIVLIFIAILFIVIALAPKIDAINYSPLAYNGFASLKEGVYLMISQSSCIAALGMLIPAAKGNIKKGIIGWNIAVYASIIVFILVIVGALGDYIKTQLFPIYTAVSLAEVGMLKHLDALYLAIWTAGMFIKVSLFLYLFSICIDRIFGEKVAKWSIFIAGIVISISSVIIANTRSLIYAIYNIKFLLIFTIFVAVFIPIILLIFDYIRTIKVRKQNEANSDYI